MRTDVIAHINCITVGENFICALYMYDGRKCGFFVWFAKRKLQNVRPASKTEIVFLDEETHMNTYCINDLAFYKKFIFIIVANYQSFQMSAKDRWYCKKKIGSVTLSQTSDWSGQVRLHLVTQEAAKVANSLPW